MTGIFTKVYVNEIILVTEVKKDIIAFLDSLNIWQGVALGKLYNLCA